MDCGGKVCNLKISENSGRDILLVIKKYSIYPPTFGNIPLVSLRKVDAIEIMLSLAETEVLASLSSEPKMAEKSTYFVINTLANRGYDHKVCCNHARAKGVESDLEPRRKI